MKNGMIASLVIIGIGAFLFFKMGNESNQAENRTKKNHLNDSAFSTFAAIQKKSNIEMKSSDPKRRKPSATDVKQQQELAQSGAVIDYTEEANRFMNKLRSNKWKAGELNQIGDTRFEKEELKYLSLNPIGNGVSFQVDIGRLKSRSTSKKDFTLLLPDKALKVRPISFAELEDGRTEFKGEPVLKSEGDLVQLIFKKEILVEGQISLVDKNYRVQSIQNRIFLTQKEM